MNALTTNLTLYMYIVKVPMKRKIFRHTLFYEWAKLSYFTFKNGKETGTEFIAL